MPQRLKRSCCLSREDIIQEHNRQGDIWVFAYASLIWRPDFCPEAQLPAKVFGFHRGLQMWSRINRGTPEQPGLVFALLPGGSCQGVAMKIRRADVSEVLTMLWHREMPTNTYTPRWLKAYTPDGPKKTLAFTLPGNHPQFTGNLSEAQYEHIFRHSRGRYGSTFDYAVQTLHSLRAIGIHDAQLARLLRPFLEHGLAAERTDSTP
jgi:cation transport protein ChaC